MDWWSDVIRPAVVLAAVLAVVIVVSTQLWKTHDRNRTRRECPECNARVYHTVHGQYGQGGEA